MGCNLWFILILVAIALLIWFAFFYSKPQKEGYNIIGALAGYEAPLSKCLTECEREDPGKRLAKANLACDRYCESTFTDQKRYNIPPPKVYSTQDKCEIQCSVGPYKDNKIAKDKCIGQCQSQEDIKDLCRQNCAYSKLNPKFCLESCILRELPSSISANWTWKRG